MRRFSEPVRFETEAEKRRRDQGRRGGRRVPAPIGMFVLVPPDQFAQLDLHISLEGCGSPIDCFLYDVNAGGVGIVCADPLEVGSRVQILGDLAVTTQRQLDVSAIIVDRRDFPSKRPSPKGFVGKQLYVHGLSMDPDDARVLLNATKECLQIIRHNLEAEEQKAEAAREAEAARKAEAARDAESARQAEAVRKAPAVSATEPPQKAPSAPVQEPPKEPSLEPARAPSEESVKEPEKAPAAAPSGLASFGNLPIAEVEMTEEEVRRRSPRDDITVPLQFVVEEEEQPRVVALRVRKENADVERAVHAEMLNFSPEGARLLVNLRLKKEDRVWVTGFCAKEEIPLFELPFTVRNLSGLERMRGELAKRARAMGAQAAAIGIEIDEGVENLLYKAALDSIYLSARGQS